MLFSLTTCKIARTAHRRYDIAKYYIAEKKIAKRL